MTITHVPNLPVKNNFPNMYFTFDHPVPYEGACKNVYLGYYHPGKPQNPIPIALARPKFYPWQLRENSRKEANALWENELAQIEKINSLFPNSKFFIKCLYVQRFQNEIIGFIFEKGICDLCDLKEVHLMFNPVTHQHYNQSKLKHFAYSMATAVGMLHKNGLVHRDVKLENFILTRTEDIKLTDFSFVIETDEREAKKYHSTIAYSSPEELIEITHYSKMMPDTYNMEWKDLWCLGLAHLHLFEVSDNCPEWLYELEEQRLRTLPTVAVKIQNQIREFLSRPQTDDYWGLLKFKPEERRPALEAAALIYNELSD